MFVGVGLRNAADLIHPRAVRTEQIDTLSSILLGLFLAIAMMSLNLIELAGVAKAMVIILAAQVALTAAFARFVTFRVMGGDYDAAVMAAGHCGFGLGAMPNAVANMQAVTERYGHAPRAFLVVDSRARFWSTFQRHGYHVFHPRAEMNLFVQRLYELITTLFVSVIQRRRRIQGDVAQNGLPISMAQRAGGSSLIAR
jgi:hypothetical protein